MRRQGTGFIIGPVLEYIEAVQTDQIGNDGERQAVTLARRGPEHDRAPAAPRPTEAGASTWATNA